ncbi:Amino acid transporter, transmembrane, partial [Nannochloropsis gaditana]
MPGVTTPGWNIVQPHPGKDPRGDSESVPGPLTSLISTDSSFYGSTNAPDILRRTTTYQAGTGTLTSSILILISSVFGSSILVVPFAFSQCGWALGTLCMIFCGLFTELGAHFLLESARLVTSMYPSVNSDALSFADIASHATPRLAFLPTVLVIVTCLGSAVSALVVAGDILPATLQDLALLFHHTSWVEDSDGKVDSYLLNRPTWVTLPLVCVLPLCFLHSITSLQYVGIVTCVTVVY